MSKKKISSYLETLTASLPLLWLSLAFLAGILVASQVHAKAVLWLLLAGISLVPVLLAFILQGVNLLARRLSLDFNIRIPVRRLFALFLTALSLGAFFLGAFRIQSTVPGNDAHNIAGYTEAQDELLVTGTVIDPPDERELYTNLRLEVSGVNNGDGWINASGLLLARVSSETTWHYGDVVRLRGYLEVPPESEDFSYADVLVRQGVHAYMPDAEGTLLPFTGGSPILRLMAAIKDKSLAAVYRLFPDPEASLLAGILFGYENGFSANMQQAFKDTGTANLIAVPGFNIAILAALFVTLFSRVRRQGLGTVSALLSIALYTVLVGASLSMVYAACVATLALLARRFGRQNGITTLLAASAVTAAFNPNMVWDAGLQLSFGATFGLVLYASPFQEWITRLLSRLLPAETARRVTIPFSEIMLFTLAAQLTTLPIMAYQLGHISLVSILAIPFILPFLPVLIILSGLALLLGYFYFPLGKLVGWAAWPFSTYLLRVVKFFNNRLPHGYIGLGDFSFLFFVLFYMLLIALTFAGGRFKQKLHSALVPSIVLIALGAATTLAWTAVFRTPDGQLHLTFLDVGSADAVLIQTPTGGMLLVDGGSSPSSLSAAIGQRLSPFDQHLDWLVVASTQEQEVAALPQIVDRFPTENVLWAGQVDASPSAEQLDRWLEGSQVPITHAFEGATLDLGSGARLKVLSVSPRGGPAG